MTTAPAPRSRAHLSIGEVLSLLQDEFPDVTISKIRFLESQGLLDPERTPSGYRKFYDEDIDRLRSILRLQKDHYLPLKVIKDRLDAGGDEPAAGSAAEEAAAEAPPSQRRAERPIAAVPEARAGRPSPVRPAGSAAAPGAGGSATVRRAGPSGPAATGSERGRRSPRAAGSFPGLGGQAAPSPSSPARPPAVEQPPLPAVDAVSLSIDELAEASGLAVRDVRDLERFGLIESRDASGASTYDGDALVLAQTAAGFLQHGIEARHMRSYKVAIDREAGLFEQIVSPVLKQRNPEARTRAARTVTELIRLGEVMRGVLLRRELRDLLGGR